MSKLEQIDNKLEKKEGRITSEMVENGAKALRDFVKIRPEEKVLILKDGRSNSDTALIFKKAAEKLELDFAEILLEKKTADEEIQKLVDKYQVIIDLSYMASDETDLYEEYIGKSGSRLVCLLYQGPEIFKEGGAISENLQDLKRRLGRMEEVLKEAVGFRITSNYGTNLEVGLRPFRERKWHKSDGVIDRRGQWDNLPGGEIFTTPDEEKVNGILVLSALDSEITAEQGVDELVHIYIESGKISSIRGGKSAEKLRKYLEKRAKEQQKEGGGYLSVYQIAEIAFGANSKARSRAADPDQPHNYPGISTVEAEKRFGTMHLGFGDSKHGEEGTEGFFSSESHLDFVIPRNGLTIEMFIREDDFHRKTKGRKIISEGAINFD